MSEFITGKYTVEQIMLIRDYLTNLPAGPPSDWPAVFLARLLDAGITVTFPEPRYCAEVGSFGGWHVFDGQRSNRFQLMATFIGADAEQYAREHTDRLNGEATA
jgi:hypothetical protein